MKTKLFTKAPILLAALLAAAMSFTACGDDSGSSTPNAPVVDPNLQPTDPSVNPQNPADTNTDPNPQVTPSSSASENVPVEQSSNSVTPPTPSDPPVEEAGCTAGEVPVPVQFPQDEFTDIGDVYKNIQCNEKVVFIVRHAQRDASTSKESPLTLDGVEAAIAAGEKLKGPGEFKFVNSGFLRTFQTVYYMAIGRGQYQPSPAFFDSLSSYNVITDLEDGFVVPTDFPTDTITQITDGWYLKDKELREVYKERDSISNVNQMYSLWIYEGMYQDVYYDLEERSKEVLNTYLVKDYSQMPKYTLMGSHDQFLMPLTSWATNKAINLIFLDENRQWKWMGFLSGLAIIINDKNEIRYAPIKGMEKGYGR